MQSADVLADWIGTAEDCEILRQAARDHEWGSEPIVDPEFAADVALSEFLEDIPDPDSDAVEFLRAELIESARRSARTVGE